MMAHPNRQIQTARIPEATTTTARVALFLFLLQLSSAFFQHTLPAHQRHRLDPAPPDAWSRLQVSILIENHSCISPLRQQLSFSRLYSTPAVNDINPSPSGRSATTASTDTDSSTAASKKDNNNKSKTIGKWEEMHGNYLLRPPLSEGSPRALLHFLGGALVGHSPHIAYRYLLERLAAKGYLVVATPYQLSFDHLTTCDTVIARFERIAGPLARTYGALPVVGVGHSCGSLLQLMITSLFPDTPRAANALLSFNNKPVSEAVPLFEEVVAPFFTYVAARNDTTRPSGSELIRVSLEMATAAAQGEVPSDAVLNKAIQALMVNVPLPLGLSSLLGQNNQNNKETGVVIPAVLRNAVSTLTGPSAAALSNAGVVPLVTEVLGGLQQIPLLIDEVADGARDFIPSPAQVKAAARRSYRARRTLLIQYKDDPIDESAELEELLQAAGQVIRMKRPMIPIDVTLKELPGNHAAPLLAPPLELAAQAEMLLGATVAKERLLYTSADQTVEELSNWLEELNL